MKFIILFLFTLNLYGQWEVPILFEHPRDGKFKFVENDRFNSSTMIHGVGSFMLTTFTSAMYKSFDVTKKPAFWGAVTVWGLGFMKEAEDGYREGFSGQDLLSNTIGCSIGYGLFAVLNYYHSKKVNIGMINNKLYVSVALK